MEIKIAETNIPCYKVLSVIKDNHDKLHFLTPIRKTLIDEHILCGDVPFIVETDEVVDNTSCFIHTFVDRNQAESFSNQVFEKVFECFIPEGTTYCESDMGYMSKQIMFKKNPDIIKECENIFNQSLDDIQKRIKCLFNK